MTSRWVVTMVLVTAMATPGVAWAGFMEGDTCVVRARLLLVPKGGAKRKNIPLKPGATLQVVGIAKQRIEVQTDEGEEGFINRVKLERDCEIVVPTAKPPAPAPAPVVAPTPAPTPAPEPPPPPAVPPEPKAAPPAPAPAGGTEIRATAPSEAAAPDKPAPQSDVVTAIAASEPAAAAAAPPPSEQVEAGAAFPLPKAASTTVQVGAVLRGTTASGELGVLLGARGAWVKDGRLSLGAVGFVSVLDPAFTTAAYRNNRYLRFFYGGVEAGYAVSLPDPVGMKLRALVGGGGVSHHSYHSSDVSAGTTGFIVVEPGVELFAAILDRLQLGVGLGYRWAYGGDFAMSLRRTPPRSTVASETSGLLNGVNVEVTGSFDLLWPVL
jgi:hypothetical protein